MLGPRLRGVSLKPAMKLEWAMAGDPGVQLLLEPGRYDRRPYRKNDNAHVEQRNRQSVRDIVGCDRYDTPEQAAWLNQVYAVIDSYANLFLPTRKVVGGVSMSLASHREYWKVMRRPPAHHIPSVTFLDECAGTPWVTY